MGARNSGPGIELRQGVTRQSIRITFQYFGRRCRESLPLPHTKTNIAYAKRLRGEIVNAIERNDFRYEEYFPNSRTAKEFRREQLPLEAPQAVVTIGDLLRDSLRIAQHNLALSTYNCYAQVAKNHLFPRWGDTRATVLTAKMLREWIMSISLKRKTIQLILTPLRNAVELGVTDAVLDASPFDSIKLAKILPRTQRTSVFRADPFDIDEIEAILAACARQEDRNMFLFAFCSGMRPSEYIALHWESVREPRHQIAVAGAYVDGESKDTAKTAAGLRNIDLRQGALAALQAQRIGGGVPTGLVFVNPKTHQQWQGDKPIYKRWKAIMTKAKVRFRNPYQTRHTFASSLLMLGAVPLYVASQLGHTDATLVTRTYGKWITAGLDDGRRERLLTLYRQTNPKRADEFPKFD